MSNVNKPYVIVVGFDYSEGGALALAQAIEMGASQESAELHVANAVSFIPPAVWVGYAPQAGTSGIPIDEARKDLEGYIAKQILSLRENRPEMRLPRIVPHVRVGPPAEEIAQLCSDLEADLVVVGTHGRRGVSRLLLGSVAEGVVRLAPCPVFVARAKRLVTVATIEPPCPECVKTRQATQGAQMWCAQHSERHGQRHTYHQGDRVSSDASLPLVYHT